MSGGTFYHDADDLMRDPPPRLTKRGLEMLTEIWIAAGRPAKPTPNADGDGTGQFTVDIDDLDSHHGTDAQRRSAARIRSHLIDGGYLHLVIYRTAEQATVVNGAGTIDEIGLSARAFDALIAAGIV